MAIDVKQIIERGKKLKKTWDSWRSHWADCAKYTMPAENTLQSDDRPGAKKTSDLYDTTAVSSLDTFASFFHGSLCNPAGTWFALETEDPYLMENDDVKEWLDQVTKTTHQVLNNTNFHTEIFTEFKHIGAFGTAPLLIEPCPKKIITFRAIPIKEVVLDEGANGLIDTVYRTFKFNVRQAVQQWGIDKVGRTIADLHKNGDLTKEVEILHAIFPREERDPDSLKATDMPWASLYIVPEDEHLISESGFPEMPIPCPRWSKTSREAYGRSPAMGVLPEIKMLNEIRKTNIAAAHKMIEPPLSVPEGYKGRVKLYSGAINYVDASGGEIKPIHTITELAYSLELEKDTRATVEKGFFKHLFMFPEEMKSHITAYEIMQRREQMISVIGPMIGRLFYELMEPQVDRIFGILLRGGYYPPPPEILQGKPLKIQYLSPIARGQKVTEANSALQGIGLLEPFIAIDPQITDQFDGDVIARDVSQGVGMPQRWLRDRSVVDDIRKSRQEAIAAQEFADRAAQGGEVVAKLAKAGVIPTTEEG